MEEMNKDTVVTEEAVKKANTFALIALIVSAVGFIVPLAPIAGLILSIIAKKKIAAIGETSSQATIALILGIVGTALHVTLIVVLGAGCGLCLACGACSSCLAY